MASRDRNREAWWRDTADTLVGRTAELADVQRLLADGERLVTITGPGGIGKSRVALRTAHEHELFSQQSVAVVDLVSANSALMAERALLDAVADGSHVTAQPLTAAVGVIHDRHWLVVLETCEHLLADVAHMARTLLATCPNVRMLATSRSPLGVPGEVVRLLPPLDVEGADPQAPGAVRLFLDRAELADREFTADETVLGDVRRVVRALDGIPLAIELAAARTRMLSVAQIAESLSPGRLSGGSRGGDVRHRTMRRCLDWSYQMLGAEEQAVFRRLAVFEAPWTLEAAAGVCADGVGVTADRIPEVVASLHTQSLVTGVGAGGGRFRMLLPIRDYALHALPEAADGDEARGGAPEELAERHMRYFVGVAEDAERQGAELDPELRAGLDEQGPDIRRALAEACRRGASEALRITAALSGYWRIAGRLCEAEGATRFALATAPEQSTVTRARTLATRANVLAWTGDLPGARRVAQEAVTVADETDDVSARAYAAVRLGTVVAPGDPTGASALFASGIDSVEEHGDPSLLADALVGLALCRLWQGDYREAADLGSRAAAEGVAIGFDNVGALGRWCAAHHALVRGELRRAASLAAEMLELTGADGVEPTNEVDRFARNCAAEIRIVVAAAQGDTRTALAIAEVAVLGGGGTLVPMGVAAVVRAAGFAQLSSGDLAGAERSARRLHTMADNGLVVIGRYAHEISAQVALVRGDIAAARGHAAALATLAVTLPNPHAAVVSRIVEAEADALEGDPTKAEGDLQEVLIGALADGLDVVVVAALEVLAEASTGRGAFQRAAALLGAADAWRESHGVRRAFAEDRRRDRILAALARSGAVDADTWGHAEAPMSLAAAVRYADRTQGRRRRPDRGWGGLTPAERDVVLLAAQGLSNPEIAQRLFIARATVKAHLSKSYAKLGVANRTELASYVRQAGHTNP
ncbi:LuxR C-terminal-related transcriptional regulator [Yinghuangia sp. YIM S09857]|uniref:LuxR C-terminal-related transcriptional regulator n=1 Tax=Yinghuangia sp. YIM S09857 TaxID=3436929 RepID=UPI003F52AA67